MNKKAQQDNEKTTVSLSKGLTEKMKIICARRNQTYEELLSPYVEKEYKKVIAKLPQ